MFQLLLEYKAQHGNTSVPDKYDKNPQLGNWVYNQRRLHSKKKLSNNRVLGLESIGFKWTLQTLDEEKWETMFQLLQEYKAQHGNTLVPDKYDKNPQLINWVKTQKRMHSKKKLLSNRVLLLESIGFVWSFQTSIIELKRWESMFQLLQEYKVQLGNTLVPEKCDKYPELGRWVAIQRWLHLQKELPSNYVSRLESIGFVFDVSENNWMLIQL